MRKTTCTIIIPAHNEVDCIVDTINSIKNQTRKADYVVVVDDGSDDKTGDIIKLNFDDVMVLCPSKNLGSKAKAQNFALFHRLVDYYTINTDVVITIDADTTLKSDALEHMLAEFDKDKSLMVACGTVIPANPDNIFTLGRLGEYLFAFLLPKRVQQELGENIYIASGCFGCYDTKTLRKHGGWHTNTMAEDMDLTARYQSNKYRVAYIPKAICYPIEPFNFATYKAQMQRWSAAFFQNLLLHWKDYISNPFGFFVFVSLLDGGIGGIIFIILPLLALFMGWQTILMGFIIGDLLFICVPVLIMGLKLNIIIEALASIPCIFFIRYLNIYFWYEALWNEVIMKKHLDVYIKGH